MKKANVGTKLTAARMNKVLDTEQSKSKKIIGLFDLGMEVKEIANVLEIRYNFAYNVISNYVNMNDIEIEKSRAAGKKEKVKELYKQGKTVKEISKELRTSMNYIYKLVNEIKRAEEPVQEAK